MSKPERELTDQEMEEAQGGLALGRTKRPLNDLVDQKAPEVDQADGKPDDGGSIRV